LAGGTWIPMYLESADMARLLAHLDDDPEIAWIVRDGGRWIAKQRLDRLPPRTICLWHIPSGPLPLFVPIESTQRPGGFRPVQDEGMIEDPFAGWDDPFGGELEEPRFGNPPGIVWLNLQMRGGPGRPDDGPIGISSFGWIGRRYALIGGVPAVSTSRWWRALRRWVAACAVRVPKEGPLDGPRPEIFAFPAALESIKAGAPRAALPDPAF